MKKSILARVVTSAALVGLLVLASCTTKAAKRHDQFGKSLEQGDFIATIDGMKKDRKSLYGDKNDFLYYMDVGVLFHYANMYDSSNVYLQAAVDVYDELFTKSVTNEAASLLTNDNVRPYRAKPYELVFLHQIAALNFMAQGKFNEALVETRRVQLHFNEWERTSGKEGKKYHTDGMFHLFSSLAYERVGEDDNSLISLYKAVEAYKMGPVPLPREVGGFAFDRFTAGDREEDIKRLSLTSFDGPNRWDAKMGQSEIVVVGYAGKGPFLTEQSWSGTYVGAGLLVLTASEKGPDGKAAVLTLPAPGVAGAAAGNTFSIKVSLPKHKTNVSRTQRFSADVGGKNYKSVTVNDMDKMSEKALDDAWNDIVLRMVVRVVTRTIAAQQAKKRTEISNPLLNLAKNVGTDIATSQMEKADIRMCFLIPQTVQVVRIPVEPGTHTVGVTALDKFDGYISKRVFENVQVGRGEKKVLIHHSLR